ncbi:MAG: hypothetical protein NC416_08415 [Eubacterium sp.]|nr:hypothetical protein [Eubacterium sp.]
MKTGSIPALKKNVGINLEDKICSAICAWCDGKGGYQPKSPGQTITYVSVHDNWTLWDKMCYTLQEEPDFIGKDAQAVQACKFAAGIVMTSLGIVFMQAGEEAGRTKQGIGDSYNSPSDLNALDWERMYQFEDLMAYYKGMLAIRRRCARYWHRDKTVLKGIQIHYSAQGCVVFSVEAWNSQDRWERLWVVYSAGKESYRLSLPKAERMLLADGKNVYSQPRKQAENEFVRIETIGVTVFGEVSSAERKRPDESKTFF